jgi:surface antigen
MSARALAIVGLAASLLLGGCNQTMTRENTGQLIGGIAGGVLGAQVGDGSGRTAAIVAGTLLGAYLGGELARYMDDNDRRQANHALEYNRTSQTSSWQNPDTGYRYDVTPERTYSAGGSACREYSTRAWIDGREELVYGTACRQSDGSWVASS